MASSSATRTGGLYRANELPQRAMAAFSVVWARMAAIRLGDGVMANEFWWCSLSNRESHPSRSAPCIRRMYMP